MKKKYFSLVLFLILTCFYAWSQEYPFDHVTTVNGLSHNEVRKITKDSEGFLWFGTQNGLNRFDGYRFKVFKNSPKDSTSILGDKIYALAASKHKLWVGTTTGLSVINTASLEVLSTKKLFETIGSTLILHLYSGPNNTVWATTEAHNYIIDATSLEVKTVLKDYKIACVANGLKNTYWLGTDKGLLQYDLTQSKVLKTYDFGRGHFNAYDLDEIYTNDYGEIWVTLGSTIFRYQSERDRFIEVFNGKSLNSIAEDHNGNLLFGSYGEGFVRYNRASGQFKTFSADPVNRTALSSNDVYEIFVTEENTVWVGTQEGLDYYDFSRHRFKSLVHLPKDSNSLGNNFVQTIYQDKDGVFWIGMRNGIDKVLFEEGYQNPKVIHFKANENLLSQLNEDHIISIYRDSKGRMWIATMSNGLVLYDDVKQLLKWFKNDQSNSESIVSNSVRSIMEDHLGRLWFGTGGGLALLKDKGNGDYGFENFSYSKYDTGSLPLNDIYSVFQDSKKRIWIGMNHGGVSLLEEQGNGIRFLRFVNEPTNKTSISNNEVFVIYEDTKEQLWFGTSGGGLNLLKEDGNPNYNKGYYFKRFTEADGLSDNEVNGILEDDSGNLWIATNKGLSQFKENKGQFVNYTTYDGVLKGKFRKNAQWKTKDGTLFFGGTAGINFFNPNDSKANNIAPQPVFTGLFIDGNEIVQGQELDGSIILKSPLGLGSLITLPAKDNRFEIEFSALSYTSPLRNEYAYKLEGIDVDWNITSDENPRASYSKLPSGQYRFYLKSANSDGVWNEDAIHLDFLVKGSFFNGKFFKIMGILLFLSTLVLGYLLYINYGKGGSLKEFNRKIKKPVKILDPETEFEIIAEVSALDQLMNREQLYLDAELSLNQLAEKMGVSANHLSMLLNDAIGKNFYDYVNHFRVEEVKQRLTNPNYSKQTISSIGGDCGFNSKSAFNRIFKNSTGKTPSQYQNKPS
ncbi:helix-turn-helix domain-containing protein [Cellulophaga sp. F20128]|uniref:two-component regulator propeller domain-containing protein n=1 Tax=Cellulophaga sp. F20128 TaxID=2926413 RepID=UPI001FF16A87|nr:two-component regulator propeller domain-containing protein [Cellulophaga sp. F20128]MCK0156303.1 helix-turn-helix domain-containing protein [Cellulophaga sp. F20128]